jgi:succinate-semialdehyde dehydrogenase/glutarate-semialdehyde dehydrogenase
MMMMRNGFKSSLLRRCYSTPVPSIIKNPHLFEHRGFINGKFTRGSEFKGNGGMTFEVRNPADGGVLAVLPRMGPADVHEAAAACSKAWPEWRNRTAKDRAGVLNRMAALMLRYEDDLAAIITLEAGKPLAEARIEVGYARSFLEFYAEEATRVFGEILQSPLKGRHLLTTRASVGPAALITPWNFPSAMITRKMGPAFAAGCPVLIKPSEEAPLSALALCAIAEEAGVPAGVINCLTVARDEAEAVGMAICHSTEVKKVSFTGSTAVGKWLMRESASTVKKVRAALRPAPAPLRICPCTASLHANCAAIFCSVLFCSVVCGLGCWLTDNSPMAD